MRIVQPTSPAEHRRALSLLMARPEISREQIEAQIDALIAYAGSYGLSLQNCLIAADGSNPVAASLCVDSPGRIASIFLPSRLNEDLQRAAGRLMLEHMADSAAARGVALLQVMLEPESPSESGLLRESGFERVARLLYLERDLAIGPPREPHGQDLDWEPYGEHNQAEFARVLRGTYEASLDCPALNGRRSMEDVLASHRAAGRFDPQCWKLARSNGAPVGLVLVNAFPERMTSEVIYMGLLTGFRHRGFGASLLRRAICIAGEQGSLTLALCVDENNAPARRLYAAFGFQQIAQRDAWIRFLDEFTVTAALNE